MIEVNNLTTFAVDKRLIQRVVRKVLKSEKKKISELSVAFVGTAKIKELNKKYRGKNQVTDILSFDLSSKNNQVSGEVVICPIVVKKNAKKFGLSFKNELRRILIHGILHLLGYDHEKSKKEARKMEKKQEYYLIGTA